MANRYACRHSHRGRAWLMQPVPGGEIRRVRLCVNCGRTLPARLAVTGAGRFDALAARAVLQ